MIAVKETSCVVISKFKAKVVRYLQMLQDQPVTRAADLRKYKVSRTSKEESRQQAQEIDLTKLAGPGYWSHQTDRHGVHGCVEGHKWQALEIV